MIAHNVWRRSCILVLLLLIASLGIGCQDIEFTILDFVVGTFGELSFSRDSSPLPPGWDPGGLLLLGCIPQTEITRIIFVQMLPIGLPDGRSFGSYDSATWGYQYPGFPKTELTLAELDTLLNAFREGQLFSEHDVGNYVCEDTSMFDRKDYPCCENGLFPPIVSRIREVPPARNMYSEIESKIKYEGRAAELQVYLPRRRIARLRIYWNNHMVAFSTGDTYQLHVSGFGSESRSLISLFNDRTRLSPIEVEFPFEDSASALNRGRRKFGPSYIRTVESLRNWRGIDSVFGRIDDIRPAKGRNHKGSWADSSWAEYTFRVTSGNRSGLIFISHSGWQLLYEKRIYDFPRDSIGGGS